MKRYFGKIALAVFLTSIALSASAKPSEIQRLDDVTAIGQSNNDDIITVARGFASGVAGPRRDVPISVARPSGA